MQKLQSLARLMAGIGNLQISSYEVQYAKFLTFVKGKIPKKAKKMSLKPKSPKLILILDSLFWEKFTLLIQKNRTWWNLIQPNGVILLQKSHVNLLIHKLNGDRFRFISFFWILEFVFRANFKFFPRESDLGFHIFRGRF